MRTTLTLVALSLCTASAQANEVSLARSSVPNAATVTPSFAGGGVGSKFDGVRLGLGVRDSQLRAAVGPYDPAAKHPFAMLPTQKGDWQRVELQYTRSDHPFVVANRRVVRGEPVHFFEANVKASSYDKAMEMLHAVGDNGVAFGVDVHDQGRVWLQNGGDNWGLSGMTQLMGYRDASTGKPAYPDTFKPKIGW